MLKSAIFGLLLSKIGKFFKRKIPLCHERYSAHEQGADRAEHVCCVLFCIAKPGPYAALICISDSIEDAGHFYA